jgi:mRNA interferase MazF
MTRWIPVPLVVGNSGETARPDAGDVVWLEFDPQAGHEQVGHRPAVGLSPANYKGKTGLMVGCPLTTRIRGCPFEAALASQSDNAVHSDQVNNLDSRAASYPQGQVHGAGIAVCAR